MPFNSNTMERMRADLIRRARMERRGNGNLEQGLDVPTRMEMEEQGEDNITLFPGPGRRPPPTSLRQTDPAPPDRAATRTEPLESPKSPNLDTRAGDALSNHFTLANLSRILPNRFSARFSQTAPNAVGGPGPISPDAEIDQVLPQRPEPATHARSTFRAASSRYSLIEDSEQPEAPEISTERRRNRRSRRRRRHHHREAVRNDRPRRRRHKKQPRRFLFCFPWVKSRRMRAYIVRCFVSGLFLVLLLSIYLGLSASKTIMMGDFAIVLILVVILATLFFSFGLFKLCLYVMRRDRARQAQAEADIEANAPMGPYAIPQEPIPVFLARDEEAVGVDSETSKMTPPAYGIWRESVRVDPNRLFWQRNDSASSEEDLERTQSRASRRPPSYISDDGVSYVVDAVPRSVAPSTSSPSMHPSEGPPMTEARAHW